VEGRDFTPIDKSKDGGDMPAHPAKENRRRVIETLPKTPDRVVAGKPFANGFAFGFIGMYVFGFVAEQKQLT
jgi:hypothetical protein